MSAPAAANVKAIDFPIPVEEPVTTKRFPASALDELDVLVEDGEEDIGHLCPDSLRRDIGRRQFDGKSGKR